MRPFTKLAIVLLFAVLLVAGVYQLIIANRDRPAYPGPVAGTPLPSLHTTPSP